MIERLIWTPELIASFWNGLSQTRLLELAFSKLAGPYLYMLARQYISEGQRHLDFGAGDGDFVRLLVEHGVPTAAFEPSLARQAVIANRLEGKFPFLGCIGPDYRGSPFDVIFMFEVIEHIPDASLADTFALIDRLLAPNGCLIITTPNNEDLELASTVDPRGQVLFHRWQHLRSLTRESLSELLQRFGFSLIVTHEIEISDRIFAAREGGLAARAELANLFNTYRPLMIGNHERLVGVAARNEVAAATLAGFDFTDDWSKAPIVIAASTTLQLAQCPMLGRQLDASPHPPQAEAADGMRIFNLDGKAMQHNDENCWTIEVDDGALGDSQETPFASVLELYEDYLPLGPRHAQHDNIRRRGRGRFSHWGSTLFFSSSDNSDPTRNNRCYIATYRIPQDQPVKDASEDS
jgi:SAM-dependent methyltransferase